MTYDVYALYAEGHYLVASGNNAAHTEDLAERVMRQLPSTPWATATLERGGPALRGPIYSMADLYKRG